MSEIASDPLGLFPIQESYVAPLCLVVKANKEMILTAKTKCEFAFYLAPVVLDGRKTYGIVTAFFDDPDEPLTITTPLFDDEFAEDILHLLSSRVFDVHFFTEDSIEVMAWRCLNARSYRVKLLMNMMDLLPGSLDIGRTFIQELDHWFAHRSSSDDSDRVVIRSQNSINTTQITVDSRLSVNSHHGRKQTSMYAPIERPDPGEQSEQDIVSMLLRVFPGRQVFLSPTRPDDGREFVDVLVSTPRFIVLIQAKDSPNTESTLRRSMARKKATVKSHLRKATAQLRGSLSYIMSGDTIQIICDGSLHDISPAGRLVVGLIIVKELFRDEYDVYSKFAFDLFNETSARCFIMDMMEFHSFTFHCRTEESFFGALRDVFLFAQHHGQFPRSRFGLVE